MRKVHAEGAFRKDLKRLKRRGLKLQILYDTVLLIQKDAPLPASARPHLLQGEWFGYWECHIANDWLLIYKLTGTELILVRTGAHADLFA